MARDRQALLPITLVRNRGLFSNHWFENRLSLEPEWSGLREEARSVLDCLGKLWERERNRVERYGAEQPLEYAFIQPVFEALGWNLIYQTVLQRREPDYALFLDDQGLDAALAVGRNSPDFWKHPAVVADAKAWHVPLNRPSVVNNQREYPPQQIEWYLDRSHVDFGILTNGGLWRLVPREYALHQRRFQTYLECDLPALLQSWEDAQVISEAHPRAITEQESVLEEFLEFYLFFSPAGYRGTDRLKPLIHRAIQGSSEYRVGVGERLKERAFGALQFCIHGFLDYAPNELKPTVHLEQCREQSFILLYRLLFIMYAEDRRLLPYRVNPTYTANRSLGRHRDEIAGRLARIRDGEVEDYSRDSTAIWDDLKSLFDLVDGGHRRYQVPEYNGGLFDSDAHPFLVQKRISDYYMARVIDRLGCAEDPMLPTAGLFPVDYRDLAIQHLGGIYEGLLELHPTHATQNMVLIGRRAKGRVEEKWHPQSKPVPKGWKFTGDRCPRGAIYLQTEKGERRASGSYYTPDHIVNYIVENTLGPLCKGVSDQLDREIAAEEKRLKRATGDARKQHERRLAQLRSDFDDRILQLRILDPAMGSGHFLIGACQRLAEDIATHQYTGDENISPMVEAKSAVSYWKRRVVESCLYGVDLNPLAVELAKLALWLETVASDEPLSFLDHHLRHGNSLVGGRIANMGALPDEMELHSTKFGKQVESKLPELLEPLNRIRETLSDTAEQIKEKDKLYRGFERAREPFRLVGELWYSAFCAGVEIVTEQYQQAVDELGKPRRFARLTENDWFQRSLDAANTAFGRCFHWELEFPEVFFEAGVRDPNGGFDAIIGNPPWGDVGILDLLETTGQYDAVASDLAECFVLQVISLAKPAGRIGQVLPDTILSPAKHKIRRQMLASMRTEDVLNLGPDWFTAKVRMSTVLWRGARDDSSGTSYTFRTCILPMRTRRAAQHETIRLDDAIHSHARTADAESCLIDPEIAIPLFGDNQVVRIVERITHDAPSLAAVCTHARGVELNKAGEVIRCPECGLWDAPARDDPTRDFPLKRCTHCSEQYEVTQRVETRKIVSDIHQQGHDWRPYIIGDEVKRYAQPRYDWIDVSADGINYKNVFMYASPKLFIRQAGIGVNAVLDADLDAFCPQSIYIYSVLSDYCDQGFDNEVLLSLICSRLFHLQVFMAFGEIDSSRAFSKLTHTRLSRLRTVSPALIETHREVVDRMRSHVRILATHAIDDCEEHDWGIEACWSVIFDLSPNDIRAIVRNFAHIHECEVLLTLFPGGVEDREEHWVSKWLDAMKQM